MTETALETAQRRMSKIKSRGKVIVAVPLRPQPVSRPLRFDPVVVTQASDAVRAVSAIEATTGMRPTPWWKRVWR